MARKEMMLYSRIYPGSHLMFMTDGDTIKIIHSSHESEPEFIISVKAFDYFLKYKKAQMRF